jgi:CheY-like chemotaxis protein
MQMPEMDGITATKLLRRNPLLQKLPIIAMTAHALIEERQSCIEAGMNDHVSKPIDPDALFSTLLRWAKPRPAEAVAPQAKPVETAEEVAIPEIAGINVGGVKRVARDKRLYRCLRCNSPRKKAMHPWRFGRERDLKPAERIAHTVKESREILELWKCSPAARKRKRRSRESGFVHSLLDGCSSVGKQVAAISWHCQNQYLKDLRKSRYLLAMNVIIISQACLRQ